AVQDVEAAAAVADVGAGPVEAVADIQRAIAGQGAAGEGEVLGADSAADGHGGAVNARHARAGAAAAVVQQVVALEAEDRAGGQAERRFVAAAVGAAHGAGLHGHRTAVRQVRVHRGGASAGGFAQGAVVVDGACAALEDVVADTRVGLYVEEAAHLVVED